MGEDPVILASWKGESAAVPGKFIKPDPDDLKLLKAETLVVEDRPSAAPFDLPTETGQEHSFLVKQNSKVLYWYAKNPTFEVAVVAGAAVVKIKETGRITLFRFRSPTPNEAIYRESILSSDSVFDAQPKIVRQFPLP